MNNRITALFSNQNDAQAAVDELRTLGVQESNLSFIARHSDDMGSTAFTDEPNHEDGKGAGRGLAVGATAGALFGLAAALIPGVGPFITAGFLASSLGAAAGGAAAGAIVGGVTGTLAGALADAGYSPEEATHYERHLSDGGVLVAIEPSAHLSGEQVVEVIRRHHGTVQGWSGETSVATLTSATHSTGHVVDDLDETARLRLHEERLEVDKERFVAGSVEVGKRVETRTENVNVELEREEIVIERHPVSGERPVEGHVELGADRETIRIDLEAERAEVEKQAYVVEEVEVGKRVETETRTFTETVGKEVLEVNKTGEVDIRADHTATDTLRETTRDVEDDLSRRDGLVDGERLNEDGTRRR